MDVDCETGGESECCGATILNGLCSQCHEHAEYDDYHDEEAPADTMEGEQLRTTQQVTPCPQCVDFGVIPPLVNYCKTCGRKLPEHGARC